MKRRKIASVEELAHLLFIGKDHLEAVKWLRFPCAFTENGGKKVHDHYLLMLCDLDWDDANKCFVSSKKTAE